MTESTYRIMPIDAPSIQPSSPCRMHGSLSCRLAASLLICIIILTIPVAAAPIITGLAPTGGPVDGGTPVTVMGYGFIGTTSVQFGGVPATTLTIVNDSQVVATTPPHPAGTVPVTVITAAGNGSSTTPETMYQYDQYPFPRVCAVSPGYGPVTGMTTVTITGSGFSGATEVRFGDAETWDMHVTDDSHITARTMESFPGRVPVTVTNTYGTGRSQELLYEYEYPVPLPANVTPSVGPVSGGTVVTITGTGLAGTSEVRFGDTAVANITIINDREISVIAPPHPAGTVSLSIINPVHANTSTGSSARFGYAVPIPAIAGIAPSSGPATGGTNITMTGSGFTGIAGVSFGNRSSASFRVINDSMVTAIAPASPPGTVPVILTSAAGFEGSSGIPARFLYETPAPSPATPALTTDVKTTAPAETLTMPSPAAPTATTGKPSVPGFGAAAGIAALGVMVLFSRIRQ